MGLGLLALCATSRVVDYDVSTGSPRFDDDANAEDDMDHIGGPMSIDLTDLPALDPSIQYEHDFPRNMGAPGFHRVMPAEVFTDGNEIIICGNPSDGPDDESAHNCDEMGCSTISHVVIRGTVECPGRAEAERLRAPAELEPESLINAERARGDALEALLIEAQDELVRLRAPAPDADAVIALATRLFAISFEDGVKAEAGIDTDGEPEEVLVKLEAAIRALAGTP